MVETLMLPTNYENTTGILRLSGGRIESSGTLVFSGGTLEGSGSYGGSEFTAGTVSPGLAGSGKISFTAGLNLGQNVVLALDAEGSAPGTEHDQLAVTGAITIANTQLSFTPTATIAIGTDLVMIQNDGIDAVNGFFNGYFDGTLFDVNQELYRTWYEKGTGNDFVIERSADGAKLTGVELTAEGQFLFSGLGTNSVTYTIFASPTVPTNVWENIGETDSGPGGRIEFTDPDAHLFKMRFYRSLGP